MDVLKPSAPVSRCTIFLIQKSIIFMKSIVKTETGLLKEDYLNKLGMPEYDTLYGENYVFGQIKPFYSLI